VPLDSATIVRGADVCLGLARERAAHVEDDRRVSAARSCVAGVGERAAVR
jgi:hypothetical protein